MKYEKNSPIAQKNAQAIEEFLLAEQAKGSEGCSRMEIEIACGLLHNQWDKPIASGKVVSACKDEPTAPVTPTKTGQPNASPWRWLYRVKVTKVK